MVLDLNKVLLQDGPLLFRSVPFGMLRARHTYVTCFAVVGGRGRTVVDGVDEEVSSQMSVCKDPPNEAMLTEGEMFEIMFRPVSRGPFEGSFYLWIDGIPQKGAASEEKEEGAVSEAEKEEEEEGMYDEGVECKKRKREGQGKCVPSSSLSICSSQRCRLQVIVTAQILRKGLGKPSLRDGVKCIAVDEEEDSDADSDGWTVGA